MEIERRTVAEVPDIEYREDSTTGKPVPVLRGYAAVFNSESRNLGGFVEFIEPRAFDKVLAQNPDVYALFNHNRDKILGNTTNGTLKLSVDSYGLRYEAFPDDTSVGRDVATWVKNRTVKASSFAFAIDRAAAGGGERWESGPRGLRKRTVTDISLLDDVSVVTRPAYDASSVVVSRRALEMAAGESNRPNQTMSNAAKRGLKAAGGVTTVDPSLISLAERIAERQIIVGDEVSLLSEVMTRCLAAKSVGWSGTLPWIEWQLAGGDSGEKWIRRRLDDDDTEGLFPAEPRAANLPAEYPTGEPDSIPPLSYENTDMSERDMALCRSYRDIGTKMGPWDESDSHYLDDDTGMIMCRQKTVDAGTTAMGAMDNMNSAARVTESRNDGAAAVVEEPPAPVEPSQNQRDEADAIAAIAALDAIVLETHLHGGSVTS